MKKATITFITSAALAFAIPLYAAGTTWVNENQGPNKEKMFQDTNKTGEKGLTQQQSGKMITAEKPLNAAGTTWVNENQGPNKEKMFQDNNKTREEGLTQQQSGKMITAEKLKGMEVVSQKGEELGEIKKVMIDKQSGEVQFVTFSRGGILGIGGEEVAVPLSAFEIGDNKARLTVDQSKIDNVPQQAADATDSDYQRNLENHYGVAPAWDKGSQGDTTKTQ